MAPERTDESVKLLNYIVKSCLLHARFSVIHNIYASVCSEGNSDSSVLTRKEKPTFFKKPFLVINACETSLIQSTGLRLQAPKIKFLHLKNNGSLKKK
jgi:hypothetical protein